jgi:RimJ/RimL family protein N-acetyltransferase
MVKVVFETERLLIYTAGLQDAGLLYAIWTDSRVMTNVGYPQGLRITMDEIRQNLVKVQDKDEFGRYLVARIKESAEAIGECKMMLPDDEGISRTDVKLLPEFWGHKYGVEIKRGLVDYLFSNTNARAVEGTPNVNNIASIKMQEAVGAIRVGEHVHHFPDSMADFTTPVHHFIYLVYRSDWEGRSSGGDEAAPAISPIR